jgi:hypothetical protein
MIIRQLFNTPWRSTVQFKTVHLDSLESFAKLNESSNTSVFRRASNPTAVFSFRKVSSSSSCLSGVHCLSHEYPNQFSYENVYYSLSLIHSI